MPMFSAIFHTSILYTIPYFLGFLHLIGLMQEVDLSYGDGGT